MELIHQIGPDDTATLILQGVVELRRRLLCLSHRLIQFLGTFADFALVRPFVRALLANKPQSLVVDQLCNASADLVRFALALSVRVTVSAGLDEVEVGDESVDQRWGDALITALQTCSRERTGSSVVRRRFRLRAVRIEFSQPQLAHSVGRPGNAIF